MIFTLFIFKKIKTTVSPVSAKDWRHFIFKRNENTLSILVPDEGKPFLEWTDDQPFDATYFFVSLRKPGKFKVHDCKNIFIFILYPEEKYFCNPIFR